MGNRTNVLPRLATLAAVSGLVLYAFNDNGHENKSYFNEIISPNYSLETESLVSSILKEKAKERTEILIPEAPVYPEFHLFLSNVPSNYCSRYVRYAAKDLFRLEYPEDISWNLRNHDSVDEIRINRNLEDYVKDGTLKPGMVLGAYYPKSLFNAEAKESGYTHVLLYLGTDGRNIYFADKFGSKTRRITSRDFEKDGLEPRAILFLRN